jgi:hypothetical protein
MKHLNYALIVICILGFTLLDGVFEYIWNSFAGNPITEFQSYAFWGCLSGLVFAVLMLKYSTMTDPTDRDDDEVVNK